MPVKVSLGQAVKVLWKPNNGSPIDLTCYTTGVNINDSGNLIDVGHYCNPRDTVVGPGEATVSIQGYHTDTTTVQRWNTLEVNDVGTLYIYPNGYTGTPPTSYDYRFIQATVLSKNWGSGVNAAQTWGLEFRGISNFITGTVTVP